MDLVSIVQQAPAMKTLLTDLQPHTHQLATGLSGSAKTLMLAAVYAQKQQPLLIVENSMFHANQLADDLTGLVSADQIHTFPVEEVLAAEVATSSPEARSSRVDALHFLSSGQPGIVLTSVAGLRRLLPTQAEWEQSQLEIKVGADIELEDLKRMLVEMGYQREQMVGKPGEFAMRGDIIDVYPLDTQYPLRIELFDTEVDAIRYFDPSNQRSIENIQSFHLLPVTDMVLTKANVQRTVKILKKDYQVELKQLEDPDEQKLLKTHFEDTIALMEQGDTNDQSAYLADYYYPAETSLIDYLPESGLVVLDDYPRILETGKNLTRENEDWLNDMRRQHRILRKQHLTGDAAQKLHKDEHAQLYLALFRKGMGNLRLNGIHDLQTRDMQQFFSQMPLLKSEVQRWRKQKQTIVVMISDQMRVHKVAQTFQDFGITANVVAPDALAKDQVQIMVASLQNGFELPRLHLVVVTEKELFNKVPKKKARRQTIENAERLKSYTELKPGDYVVHVNHGIGKYVGMQTLTVDGVHQDYITIQYRGTDKLFIPVTQLNLIQKYVSAEGKTPHVNKLGGSEWQKTKNKVASKVEDIADDLVDLYAARESQKGFAFSKDNDYQREFDDEFPYPETDDQLRSIAEVKHDMEQPKPMDRLLVGDVGFGKTEVALRAAFKAVQDGKQVAFLVPTTILAQQHYDTMVERFADFPVNIAILSRFRTTKQIHESLKGLADGSIDIVVGTHRLLSKDVHFHDLGFLIVDEEQRFGVKHKERLKKLKANIDVLTLTATPIPRTLHMSMLGVRDLSVIETPPTNRYPIQTYVMEQNAGAIREAIEREMDRNGQTFYLHNRVSDIERTVDELQALVPNARIAYAHGQMSETQLESILYDFIHGDYDVLVTTTIIETGVDMPNVNTMIIEDADRYGLSQLYQLRGRIGRSNRVAYAYLMYQQDKVLTEVGESRLKAIKDFTELGSGFKIAMRDLSIRGAGNLLGKQQHGFIDSVGFDLYSQMLNDAIAKKRGHKVEPKTNAEVDLKVEAFLPSSYISDSRQKIEMYKQIRQVSSVEAFHEVQDDLMDRFGDYPQEVTNLLEISRLKMIADRALVKKVERKANQIIVRMSKEGTQKLQGDELFSALSKTKLKATVVTDQNEFVVTLVIQPKMDTADWLKELGAFLSGLKDILQGQTGDSEKQPQA
ncbi:transcription-repair coupling factor [Lactobacillus selangorensis]|uniref:Transcription-repair-coupling factor n=1 Tax=Lactobacillus selangorensis TaxID=81857 RepID=A0A0R2FQ21_9LACO|nr:transcription-repair coupling factor [Lactobacillus selangorensis]KRN27874.1 transcription-repair coupling factor [Lactobacillus selangorensis]KRN30655.1 transcription-repair coupling factor [Lactobacillus selangorensis]